MDSVWSNDSRLVQWVLSLPINTPNMLIALLVLIRAVSDFLRARRHEQLVLQSPDRGLSIPVIAEGEHDDTVV